MFERFTERARQVVVLAQDEARTLRHNYIGTEHILLGLLREEEGLAVRVLNSLDVTPEEVRTQVARIVGSGEDVTTGQIPFTPRAKKVLELSLREALSLDHNYIGTEHILLGLVRENDGVAARILLDFDVDADAVRDATIDMLAGPGPSHTREARLAQRSEERRQRLAEREAEAAGANPQLAAEIEHARQEKERAIAAGEFDKAAGAHEAERRLRRMLLGLHPETPPEPAVSWSPASGFRWRSGFRRSPLRVATSPSPPPAPSPALLMLTGALIFAVALVAGITIGRLIWG